MPYAELFYPLLPPNIDSIDDKALLRYIAKANSEFGYWAQFHYAIKLDRQLSSDEYEEWMAPGLRMLDAMSCVEMEVFNGGFIQYFTNSSGNAAPIAIAGFRKIGCERVSDLIEKALQAVFQNEYETNWEKRVERVGDDERWETALRPLDEQFCTLLNEIYDLMTARTAVYVRAHPEEFFRTNPALPERFSWMRGKGF